MKDLPPQFAKAVQPPASSPPQATSADVAGLASAARPAQSAAAEPGPGAPRERVLSVRQALTQAAGSLSGDEARREAELLLMQVLDVGRSWLFAHADDAVELVAQDRFFEMIDARRAGEPVAYLLGWREFYGLRLAVSPATLIPRHDTETLVEQALLRLPRGLRQRVLDLGTGSGAIALALAHTRPELEVWASDASAAALAIAQGNARALGLDRVSFVLGDWLAPFAGERFDVLLSNPPYIEAEDPHLQQGDLRFEPACALASGADGLSDLRRIVCAAPGHLREGGWLLFEHGAGQGAAARSLLGQRGFAEVFTALDLEHRERVSGGRWMAG